MIYTMVSEHRIEHRREKTTTLKAIILKIFITKINHFIKDNEINYIQRLHIHNNK